MNPPLIFIHYGAAPYLRWTLRTARRTNPGKRIILLGDAQNRSSARGLAEHVEFSHLEEGPELAEFDRVFQVLQGDRHRFNKLHGTEFWLRFVFRRWFLIANFLRREHIEAFWTFDSDTLVLAPLQPREARYRGYDCTEQCRGECLNGFVGSRTLVENYIRTINLLFQDPDYLQAQRERLKTHAGLSFNEMDAYREFRSRHALRTIRAVEPIDGEVFDDALAFIEDYEESPEKLMNRTQVKRLWAGPGGGVFARRKDGRVVRMITANLSWMPLFMYRRLARFATPGETDRHATAPEPGASSEITYQEPLSDKAWRHARLVLAPLEKTAFAWLNRIKPCR